MWMFQKSLESNSAPKTLMLNLLCIITLLTAISLKGWFLQWNKHSSYLEPLTLSPDWWSYSVIISRSFWISFIRHERFLFHITTVASSAKLVIFCRLNKGEVKMVKKIESRFNPWIVPILDKWTYKYLVDNHNLTRSIKSSFVWAAIVCSQDKMLH
jgi:hypothetical protein